MVKTVDNALVILLALVLFGLDHLYGSQFLSNLCTVVATTTQHYASDRVLIVLALLLLAGTLGIWLYIRRLDKQYVSLTCTPQLTSAEFDYLAKKTTIEKLRELKSLPQYKEVLERSKLRESTSPTSQRPSNLDYRSSFVERRPSPMAPDQDQASYSRRSVPNM